MIRVEMNTVVARPIEESFGRLTDLSDYSRWRPKLGIFIRCGQTSEGLVGEGTTYYDRGRRGTFRGEIVEFRPPTRVAFRESLRWLGVKVMEARPAYELVRTQTGTEVRHTAEGQPLWGLQVDGTGGGPGGSRGEKEDGRSSERISRKGTIAAWSPSPGWRHIGEVVGLLFWQLVTGHRQQSLRFDIGGGSP
jgi:uncharacterized protein YndB with AHSA1/START domain